jgi:hypothetical protein
MGCSAAACEKRRNRKPARHIRWINPAGDSTALGQRLDDTLFDE